MTYRSLHILSLLLLVSYSPAAFSASGPRYLFNRADFPTGNFPVAVVTGDFNGDGRQDLAVVNNTDKTVSILLGQTDGTFSPHTDFATAPDPIALV